MTVRSDLDTRVQAVIKRVIAETDAEDHERRLRAPGGPDRMRRLAAWLQKVTTEGNYKPIVIDDEESVAMTEQNDAKPETIAILMIYGGEQIDLTHCRALVGNEQCDGPADYRMGDGEHLLCKYHAVRVRVREGDRIEPEVLRAAMDKFMDNKR